MDFNIGSIVAEQIKLHQEPCSKSYSAALVSLRKVHVLLFSPGNSLPALSTATD